MTVICRECKHEMKELEGTFVHIVFEKKITVENVPYFQCENNDCGNQFYSHQKEVEQQLTNLYHQR